MENGNIVAKFEHSILTVQFLENAKIEIEDVKELYDYANKWANGRPYCVMFDALHHFEVSEEAAEFISNGNPNDEHVLAKAYVISTKEAQLKAKTHLAFDHPRVEPKLFFMVEEARKYLEEVVAKHNAK
jgi:hypothetical protein